MVGWYALNTMYNIYSKKAANMIDAHWFLALFQLGVGIVWSISMWATGVRKVPKLTAADIAAAAHVVDAGHACRVDAHSLHSLLAEIEDPALRRKVWQLCTQVVDADLHLADGESSLLMAAVEHWGLQDELQAAATTGAR